ncbi:MAG: DUF2812 domain-containing protein [Clostridium cochlearium]|uniref:DUF2812 domain-containing protein n=1 Tax=Clostridium cochlearium TaxID=1494 RepID=A0A7Y3XXV7_CLOCO|nr:DUF2812 domain-containing protein [Clostridium cochlearium]MDU1444107.1 DUF2812 domain-containing protein [Clostridium cochlearium]NOH15383.1 DUF2812 domain-containing protein [Clostridium cochlearium]
MKNKYVMISGLAFSEESDMEKLKNYAREGWILEDIIGGFFYKLKKDKPQDIVYSVDYQSEADEEYFTIFKEAGWKSVVSLGNQMHIFSAQVGTKPIYSDCESEIDKYISARNQTRKGTFYSLIIAIVLIGLLYTSLIILKPMFLIIFGLLIIDIVVFVFNFMPYLAYSSRVKQIKKYGKCKSKIINNKNLWKIDAFTGVMFLALGISDLIEKKYYAVFFIIVGVSSIVSSLNNYKKKDKKI